MAGRCCSSDEGITWADGHAGGGGGIEILLPVATVCTDRPQVLLEGLSRTCSCSSHGMWLR